jgi:hypothetical protein
MNKELYEKLEVFRKREEEVAVVIVPGEGGCVKWFDLDENVEFVQRGSIVVLLPKEVWEEIKEQLG